MVRLTETPQAMTWRINRLLCSIPQKLAMISLAGIPTRSLLIS